MDDGRFHRFHVVVVQHVPSGASALWDNRLALPKPDRKSCNQRTESQFPVLYQPGPPGGVISAVRSAFIVATGQQIDAAQP